jgi:hypothetical protein
MQVAEARSARRARRTLDTRPISDDIVKELVEAMSISRELETFCRCGGL